MFVPLVRHIMSAEKHWVKKPSADDPSQPREETGTHEGRERVSNEHGRDQVANKGRTTELCECPSAHEQSKGVAYTPEARHADG
jgi:hypothetical protein